MRKRPILMLSVTLLVLAGIGSALAAALKHEPGFYRRAAVDAGPERKVQSKEFQAKFVKLINRILDGKGKWSFAFDQEEINSFFEEDFVRLGEADALAKLGIQAPRVQLDDETVRIAFRYGSGFWSTVLTYELHVWLVPSEVNTLAVEIVQRKAGGLPIAAQSLLSDFKELARVKNLDVTWYRQEGNPVAIIRLPTNRTRPNAQLLRFDVADGQLTIVGESFEPTVQRTPPSRALAANDRFRPGESIR
jgi:hypothetical protein